MENAGHDEVVNVHWTAADFYRDIIPPDGSPDSCAVYVDEVAPTLTNGPLYYGVSSQHYDTTVRQPKNGWEQASLSTKYWPDLDSTFTLYQKHQDGSIGKTEVTVSSGIKTTETRTIIFYLLHFKGDTVKPFLLVPSTPEMIEGFHSRRSARHPYSATYNYTEIATGAVPSRGVLIVYDLSGKAIAVDSPGVYTSFGASMPQTPERIWRARGEPE